MGGNGDIAYLQQTIADWANSILPNRTVHQALSKLVLEEIPEFLTDTDSPGEYADVIILILDVAYLKGIDVKKAILDKMEINKLRKWDIDPDTGLAHHKR